MEQDNPPKKTKGTGPMSFDNIGYIWISAVIPFFILFSTRAYLKNNQWLGSFSGEKRNPAAFIVKTVFFSLMLAAVVLAVAGPRVQYEKAYFNRAGIELAIGIDVSKSMLAEDINFPEPGREMFHVANRLNRARYFVLNTTAQLHGEKIGVYIFADKGIEIVPFTNDYGYCHYIVRYINDNDITIPGSDLAKAIRTGMSMFENAPSKSAKAIILFSDGEDISADKSVVSESARLAAEKGIRIYTVGVGGGKMALIPLRSEDGTSIVNYLLDEDGTYLKTRLEQDTLKKIADRTGGLYFRVDEDNAPAQLIDKILQFAKDAEQAKSIEIAWLDLSPFFLTAAIAFIFLEMVFTRFCSVKF